MHAVPALKYFLDNVSALKESPEVKFNFDWNHFAANEEIFYIRIGEDRMQGNTEILGPYSLHELNGAFLQKRINEQTYIYTPGMLYWERVGAVPKLQDLWKLGDKVPSALDMQSPDLVVLDREPVPVVSVIKLIEGQTITILCGHHFIEGDEILISLYRKEELQAKNLRLKVIAINQFNQTIDCDFSNISDEHKKILNDCAK